MPLRIAVLLSGRGSNFLAIQHAIQKQDVPAQIIAVISNQPGAPGLQAAADLGLPTHLLNHRAFRSRDAYDRELARLLDDSQPDLIVLAGFMRILTPAFVHHFAGRIINIHPSLLPRFPGLHTHRRVLEAGDTVHGASVHFVNDEVDGGPIIAQVRIAVAPADNEESLAQRVLAQEHQLYPRVIQWIASGELEYRNGEILLAGRVLTEPVQLEPLEKA